MRLLIGFAAGALAHLVFQGALGAFLYAAGLEPDLVWSLAPVPPLGIPTTVNNMFWDGLWGMVYALLERRLTARLRLIPAGCVFGLGPLFVYWFVVLPLKGAGIGGGFEPAMVLRTLSFDIVFGLGTALIYAAINRLLRRQAPTKASGSFAG
jgi:hypothetical protein